LYELLAGFGMRTLACSSPNN